VIHRHRACLGTRHSAEDSDFLLWKLDRQKVVVFNSQVQARFRLVLEPRRPVQCSRPPRSYQIHCEYCPISLPTAPARYDSARGGSVLRMNSGEPFLHH
jgi:hypothetical protein